MYLNVYLIKDRDSTVINTFTSELQALNFIKLNRHTEIERVTIKVPDLHFNNKILNEEIEVELKTLDDMVKIHIENIVFKECQGNIAKASRILKMSPTNLRHKMKKLGLK